MKLRPVADSPHLLTYQFRSHDMKKFVVAATLGMGALFSAGAFAQAGGINVPGLFSSKASAGSDIENSKISVINNKARNVTVGGGKAGIKVASVEMDGIANVNSINITGSRIKGSEITVSGNEAEGITAIGGTANVNSININ
jgi:hypothetical protein